MQLNCIGFLGNWMQSRKKINNIVHAMYFTKLKSNSFRRRINAPVNVYEEVKML